MMLFYCDQFYCDQFYCDKFNSHVMDRLHSKKTHLQSLVYITFFVAVGGGVVGWGGAGPKVILLRGSDHLSHSVTQGAGCQKSKNQHKTW